MAIPVGNDIEHIRKQIKEVTDRKEAVTGGFRFTLCGTIVITVQDGLLDYDERQQIRKVTGSSVEALQVQLEADAGADTMAAVIWVGMFQEHGADAPTIGEIQEFVAELTSDDIGEIERLSADEEPTMATTLSEADMGDPKSPGPRSTTTGPLSLPATGYAQTISVP